MTFKIRLPISLAAFLCFFFWPSCVSRTLPETRFAESQGLAFALPQVAVADPSKFSFSVVGDLHLTGARADWLSKMLLASSGDGDSFSILLGDMADKGTAEQVDAYHQAVAGSPLAGKVFYVVGNHDIFDGGWEVYKAKSGPSHYSFAVGNAKFIAFDTADASLGDLQTQWLRAEVDSRTETHLFLLSHYAPLVPGIRSYLRFADSQEAQSLMKMATEKRVTAWLAAHYHSYVLEVIDSVSYLIAGGGGGRRMEPVLQNFYAKVSVDGPGVSFQLKKVE